MVHQTVTGRRQMIVAKKPVARKWKQWFLMILFALTLTCFLFFLWQPASAIICLTNHNTYCSAEQIADLDSLKQTPWIRSANKFPRITEQITQKHQDIVDVHFRRTFPRNIEVEMVKANALFIASTPNQNWQLYDNGFLKEVTETSLPLFTFPNEDIIRSLSSEQSQQMAYLYQKAKDFTPRWKEIRYLSGNEIEAEMENRGKVLLKLGDDQIIDTQLATLQSFLRSSTMDQDYKALDLRFEGLAVVKE